MTQEQFKELGSSLTEEQFEAVIAGYLIQNGYNTTIVNDYYAIQPIYSTEDSKGNVLFDTDSILDEFRGYVIEELDKKNYESDYDWDE